MYKILLCLILTGCFSLAYAQDFSSQAVRRNGVRRTRPVQRPVQKPVTKKADEELFTHYIFNAGAHTEFFNNIQSDSSGGVRKFDFAPTLGVGLFIPMDDGFNFLPEFNWVLPQMDEDSKIMKNILMFRADWGYNPIDWFRVRVGTSIIWLNQHGDGGSTKVNNGNTTSTFYYPDENRSSFNNTLDVGTEFIFGEWAARLQTYTYAVFKEERRQVSYTLFISYYWDR